MNGRSTISRREPVIALESFRYRGRNYKEGGHLDRRRCRMPHSKLVRLLRNGVCILAKNLDPEKLAEYGFKYNPRQPRLKLTALTGTKLAQSKIDLLFGKEKVSSGPELVHIGGGWFNVSLEDKVLNENSLRKEDAETFISDYLKKDKS